MNLRSREIAHRLIAFDTTSRLSNLALIEWVEGYLDGLGVESRRVYDDGGRKANLYATVGPRDRSGIMLSGHTDVVPVEGQDWSVPPFAATERDGRLYGRGSADMKTFLAVVLAFLPEAVERGLETPLHLAFSYDEEVGCLGARGLVDLLNGMEVRPRLCIVGEPTGMQPVVAHKGKLSMRGVVTGLEGHSSLAPDGVNAVQYAAEAIAFVRRQGLAFAAAGPFDREFDCPHTTAHVGVVRGGTALNIIPNECRFEFEYRHLPADDPQAALADLLRFCAEELEPGMKAVHPDAGFAWEPMSEIPALDIRPDDEVVSFVKHLAGRNDHGKVAFGTEAGLFHSRAGIPTAICGPGSIVQAHKPDEYIALEQIARGEAFMARLLDHCCVR